MPNLYGYSANTLAVRMAEIYGGRHLALTHVWPARVADEYEAAVRDIDLLLCGAGTHDGLLFNWLREETHIGVPPNAVGDICLQPISAVGEELPLRDLPATNVRRYPHPNPAFTELKTLAHHNRVIYLARGYPQQAALPAPACPARRRPATPSSPSRRRSCAAASPSPPSSAPPSPATS
jgi:hypothetical protein